MYTSKPLFSYAQGSYMVFPKGFENRDVGEGSLVIEEDYIIYFKPGTSDDVKERLTKDYAKYHQIELQQQKDGIYCN